MSVNNRQAANGQRTPGPRPATGNERPDSKGRNIFVALDIETTGVESEADEIIEIAAVRFRLEPGGQATLLERWQTLVRPSNPIPYKITHLTGIRQSDVEHAPVFGQVKERLRSFMAQWPIVGHSIESDFGFLARQNFQVNNRPIDTFELATLMLPQTGNYSLVAVASTLGVKVQGDAHRAMADTLMAMGAFAALVGKIEELPGEVLTEINRVAADLPDWPLAPLFRQVADYSRRTEATVGAFGNLGALLKQQLATKSGTNGQASDLLFLLPAEPPAPLVPRPDYRMPSEVVDDGGPLTVGLYENIKDGFERGQHTLIETPGGERERALGLVAPAVEISVANGQSIVLAVDSPAQRDRLINRVIPELQQRLAQLESFGSDSGGRRKSRRSSEPPPFSFYHVKHQNSYLCLQRWEHFRQQEFLTADELKLIIKVLCWLPTTSTGDGSELRIMQQERLWSRINVQKALCLQHECQFAKNGSCFFYRAKDQATAAHVVLAEQSLVLADLIDEAGTLPPFDYAIVDDAHHLEDAASRQFGTVITSNTLLDFLDWLSRPISWQPGNKRGGFVSTLAQTYFGPKIGQAGRDVLEKIIAESEQQINLARNATGNFLQDLAALLQQINHDSGQGDGRLRLDSKFRNGSHWDEIAGTWELLRHDWEELFYILRDLRDEADALQYEVENHAELQLNLNYYVNRCNDLLNQLVAAFEGPQSNSVYWLGQHPRTQMVNIYSAPLEVAQGLENKLFHKKKSVALVSATLTTEGDFGFIRQRLGLHDARLIRLPADYDWATTLLYLPTDMPEPSQAGYQKTIDQQILELARTAGGRTVVLFSSNSSLRMTYKAVQYQLEQANILVLGLGLDGTRRSVLERFKNTEQAVLLTTLGHWEGGELLGEDEETRFNTLVVTKLPFDPPSDPVFAARNDSRLWDDAFAQYGLPRTILRFRQVFERLLTSQREHGAVVMLDSRLTRKTYGPTFLNSLPPFTVRRENLSGLVTSVTGWLSRN